MKIINTKIKQTFKSFLFVSIIATGIATEADDTEVFASENISNNLLFVMDVSGSMRQKITTVTVNGVTTTSGGTPGVIDQPVTDSGSDAFQLVLQEETETTGVQTNTDEELNFVPGNIVGIRYRFSRNTIPQGATIKSAYLRFRSTQDNSEATEIDIFVEDASAIYADAIYGDNGYYKYDYYHSAYPTIVDRPEFGPVRWQPGSWSNNSWNNSADVTTLVQAIVNKSDWDSISGYDSSLAFKFVTQSGARNTYSRDYNEANSPELYIVYEKEVTNTTYQWVCVDPNPYRWSGCNWGGWRYQAQTNTYTYDDDVFTWAKNSDDDAEQAFSAPPLDVVTDETTLSFDSDKIIGLRFDLSSTSSTIPRNSVITNAYIQFTAAEAASDAAEINIQIENTGNSLVYGGSNPTIKQRNFDEEFQRDWVPGAWISGDSNFNQRTPDLTQQVQHVIDTADGEALGFRLFGSLGTRVASANDAGSGAPVLHIEYQVVAGTSGEETDGETTTVTRVETRLKLMQEAIREVLVDAPNVNVGLMKYSGMNEYGFGSDENTRNHFVGGVVFPVSPIYENASDFIGSFDSRDNLPSPGSKNVREFIADVADEWEAEGGTPIVDALYEAALYYRGEPMHYGKNKNNTDNMDSAGSHPASYEGGTEMPSRVDTVGRSSIANANYISPIKSECQSNYIVLMSDGAPTYYYSNASTWGGSQGPFATTLKSGHASELATAIDNDGACLTGNGENVDTTVTRLTAGTCGREITQYLANNDQMPDAGRSDNDGVEGEQTVKTFTIGFGQDLEDGAEEYLRSLETVDGNGYYTADNKTQLKDAFRSIFETVSESSGSLSSPGYSVNVKSGLEHEEDIYIPVFDRRNTPTWSGNLKKFKLVDVDGERKIRGKNNQNAVNNLGSFTDDAFDYWSASTTADGKDVLSGGVAQLITPVDRLVLTDVGCTANDCNLTVSGNSHKLKNENTDITSTLLDLDDQGLSDAAKATKRTRIINYIRGWEDGFYDSNATVQGIPRRHMGDMLHSEPVVITYNKGAADGTGKKQFIFAGTNEGYLHAFDTDSGEESFAFMPSELLKNIDTMYEDNGTADDHKYGVDGSLTYWHDDADGNGNVNGSESVYLYFGLRRGGRSYYVLDISGLNATEPTVKLKWKISGEGTISANDDDEDSSENDLAGLGQSWSPPYLAKVGITSGTGSAIKEAVIISGGYDEQEDEDVGNTQTVGNINTSDAATMGNNIYILDAKTGALLWSLRKSMGDSQVTRSIPGGLRVLDTTNNGVVDRIYFADTGGSLWRLDLSETLSLTSDTESVLKKLAFLGDSSGTGSNARMFYNEPGVAILSPNGKTSFAVSIGSGFRAHPNDKTIDDKFFVIKDYYPLASLPSDFETVDIDDLASISVGDTITHTDFETKTKGWYLSLPEDGEKVLASSVTVDGVVSFTTLVPATHTEEGVDPCAAPITSGRYYAINMITGEPGFNLDNSRPTDTNPEAITDNDLYITGTSGEIPGKPQVVFNGMTTEDVTDDDGTVTKVTCEHPVDIRVGKRLDQVTGYNACRLESIYWNHPEE